MGLFRWSAKYTFTQSWPGRAHNGLAPDLSRHCTGEIRQVLGLTDSETKNVLHHMHLNGSVQCLDKSGARP